MLQRLRHILGCLESRIYDWRLRGVPTRVLRVNQPVKIEIWLFGEGGGAGQRERMAEVVLPVPENLMPYFRRSQTLWASMKVWEEKDNPSSPAQVDVRVHLSPDTVVHCYDHKPTSRGGDILVGQPHRS